MGKKHSKGNKRRTRATLALILGSLAQLPLQAADLVPLPEDIFDNKENANPILDVTKHAVSSLGSSAPEIPDE